MRNSRGLKWSNFFISFIHIFSYNILSYKQRLYAKLSCAVMATKWLREISARVAKKRVSLKLSTKIFGHPSTVLECTLKCGKIPLKLVQINDLFLKTQCEI